MKHEIEHVNSSRKILRIEVPGDALREAYEHTLKEVRQHAALPGFRKGKVPRQVVEQRFRKEIRHEMVEHLVPRAVLDALKEENLHPITDPRLLHRPEHSLFREDAEMSFEPLKIEVGVEVYPKVELRRYKGLPAVKAEVSVTEEDVEKTIESLRERAAALVPAEGRAAQKGDYLTADVAYEVDGTPKRDQNVTLCLDGELHPAFLENLAGLRAGEGKSFQALYAEDFPEKRLAGKQVAYRVDIKALREKRLPALDDAFAGQISDELKTLGELRAKVREDLLRHREAEARKAMVEQLLQALVKENPVDLPEAFVERQMDAQLEDAARFLAMRGQNPREAKVDWTQVRESGREDAHARVHAMLLLAAVAEQEKLEVSPADLEAEFARMAASLRASVEEVRKHYSSDEEAMGNLRARLRREKAVDFLAAHATLGKAGA
jgi:trigger factor